MLATFLFVPAHDARKVAKAIDSAADAVILDLEDAVPEQTKDAAREAAAKVVRDCSRPASRIWVRVNAAQTVHHEADVRAIEWSKAGLLLPKAEDPSSIQDLSTRGLSGLILTLESTAGFANVQAMLSAGPQTQRLALGTFDLAHDLGLPVDNPDESELIWHLRCEVVLLSRRLGLLPPIDGVYGGRIDDAAGFESIAQRAYRLGFGGKLLIHPLQIPIAARVFRITEAQVAEARRLIDAYEDAQRSGTGAIRHAGQMVDAVHVERARALLAQWTSMNV